MTVRELSQLYYLNREIEMDAHRLQALTREMAASRWPGMVRDIRDVVADKHRRCIAEHDRLAQYIAGIPDPLLRETFGLRYVEQLKWDAVSMRLGGVNSGENLRVMASRYLRRNP